MNNKFTTEMIEFFKSVEQLWASYESVHKRFYREQPVNAQQGNAKHYRSLGRKYSEIDATQAQDGEINIALKTTNQ